MTAAAKYIEDAISRDVNPSTINQIRFHARACFNRQREELEMLRAIATCYGYGREALQIARDEWTLALDGQPFTI